MSVKDEHKAASQGDFHKVALLLSYYDKNAYIDICIKEENLAGNKSLLIGSPR